MRRSAAPVGTTAWLWTPRRPSRLRRDVEQTLREFDLQRGGFAVLAALRRSGTPYAAVTDQDLARSILGFPEDRYLAWMRPCAG